MVGSSLPSFSSPILLQPFWIFVILYFPDIRLELNGQANLKNYEVVLTLHFKDVVRIPESGSTETNTIGSRTGGPSDDTRPTNV